MKIGFTGSREGLTSGQISALAKFFEDHEVTEVHHGDCVGADAIFHSMSVNRLIPSIVVHPPSNEALRKFCEDPQRSVIAMTVLEPKSYLARNRDIVNCADGLIACPNTMEEKVRSGTWSTIRYGQKVGNPVLIIYPNGSIEER